MRLLIFGATGSVGRLLVEQALAENHIVTAFVRDPTKLPIKHTNLHIAQGDVLDYPALEKAMAGADVVVHAAGIAGIDTVIKDPVRTMQVNMIGTANALEAAYKNKVKDRFVDFSTSEVFGSMAFRSSESDATVAGSAGEARWTYAVSKLAGEHLAHAYHRNYNLPTVTVRPFNVYGPGQTGEGALQIFIKKALKP